MILLAVVVQCVVGDQIRIIYVSELISVDEDLFTNGEDNNSHICCVYGNCTCNSLDHALANLTSNVLINITTDVMLPSLIERSDLQNVSITGHNNPTVNCKNAAGIHFKFCHNCIIQGIAWNKCGSTTKAGLMLNNYSNVTIQNCSFQHSLGQVIVLSEVSGNVNINNCNFVNNSQYRDHGTVIHYYSSITKDFTPNFEFNINNCKFSHNKHAKSLIYIESGFEHNSAMLCNSIFQHNKGVSIFLVNKKLGLNGKILFQNNNAEDGTAIYISDYSTVVFGENSNVMFIHNYADNAGGAILSRNHSKILFNQSSKVRFTSNSAGNYGAAIYSLENSQIIFTGNSKVKFNGNAGKYGNPKFPGTIYTEKQVYISFESNTTTYFSDNIAYVGGAIFAINNCHISLKGKSNVVFSNNTADYGGAVYLRRFSSIYFEGNSTTVFDKNTASNYGGAIRAYDNSNLYFEGNSTTVFINNPVSSYGGAIGTYNNSNVSFEGNSIAQFSNNSAGVSGGAIYLWLSIICFKGDSTTEFSKNTASIYGGAIRAYNNSNVSFKSNSVIQFSNNIGGWHGGALYVKRFSNICFEENSTTVFNNNTASSRGGAIRTFDNSNIYFEGNSTTEFNNNTSLYYGGAISTHDNNICFEGSATTVFSNNTASNYGGAINSNDNSNISFEENSITQFCNNTAKYGGAIDSYYNSIISFKGNSTTEFSNNIAFKYGAVVYALSDCDIAFDGYSKVTLTDNKATNGAIVYSYINSKIMARGDSRAIFNNIPAKWCSNVCLPYTGDGAVTIDGNGIVRCGYQEGFTCQMKKCYCKEFERNLNNHSLIVIKDTVILSSVVSITNLNNVSIIGQNNPFVYCVNGSRLIITNSSNIVMEGITWIGCGDGTRKDGNKILDDFTETDLNSLDSLHNSEQPINPVIHLQLSMNIKVQNCVFQYSEGQVIILSELSGELIISHCNFVNNSYYRGHGAAIHYSSKNSKCFFIINNCNFAHNSFVKSLLYIENKIPEQNNITICDSKFYRNQGVSIHVANQQVYLTGKILFSNNIATNGSGIYVTDNSTVMFGENSDVAFTENIANHKGSAIFLQTHSTILFGQNSKVIFRSNIATSATVYSETNSDVIFKGNCQVTFTGNSVTQYGAAIHSFDNSSITFKGRALVHINNAISRSWQDGGAIFSKSNGRISFEENSVTLFNNNTAGLGAAILLNDKCNVKFKDRSRATFTANTASSGGAVALYDNCTATIEQFSHLIFNNNTASECGGALHISYNCNTSFTDNSVILFVDNKAEDYGGAVSYNINSRIKFEKNSTIIFENNTASFGENLYSNGSSFTDIRNANLIINNITARWLYDGQFTNKNNVINDIIIDANGIVRCNDHKEYYICQYKKCYCENIENIPSNVVVIITKNITLSSTLQFKKIANLSLIGYNSSVYCENDSGLQFISCSNITITNLTWSKINSNGRNTSNNITPQIKFYNSSNIAIDHCTFQQSVGRAVVLSEVSGGVNIKHCKFVNNEHTCREHGAAIYYSSNCTEYSKDQLIISDCHFTDNSGYASLIFLENLSNNPCCKSNILQNSDFSENQMTCIYLSNQNLYIKGSVLFENNEAENGAGIFISDHSNITFGKASNVMFAQNTATINGGAIYVNNWSSVVFENNAHVMFTSNKATSSGGTIYSYKYSGIILKENSAVRFAYNHAEFGGTLYIENNSFMITKGKSTLTVSDSEATYGGAFYFKQNSNMTITENSTTKFTNNEAIKDGGCIYSDYNSIITFQKNSITKFYRSQAIQGGVIYMCNNRGIILDEYAQVWFNDSTADKLGGTLYIEKASYVITKGICILTICNSEAINGGAIYLLHNSNMTITENSTVTFVNNEAENNGGSIYSASTSIIVFNENSATKVHNSRATKGGTIYSYDNSNIILDEKSKVYFNYSTAELGGTFCIEKHSYIITKGRSTLTICNSEARSGGASYLSQSASMTITEKSTILLHDNYAKENGGSIYCNSNSSIMFSKNSVANINKSRAARGGGIYSYNNSNIILDINSQVWFDHSIAKLGGTLYIENHSYIVTKGISVLTVCNSDATSGGVSYLMYSSTMTITENSMITFLSNEAKDGGVIFSIFNSSIMFKGNSTVTITKNKATQGGAIYSGTDSSIEFDNNSTAIFNMNEATKSGGSIYTEQSNIQFKGTCRVIFNNSVLFNGAGGAIFCTYNSSISFISCSVIFYKNTVYNGDGGAICCTNSNAIFEGTSDVEFHSNKATYGGAVDFNMDSSLIIRNNAVVVFNNNSATMGGAVHFHENSNGIFETNSTIALSGNSALQNGGAFYLARHCYVEFKEFANFQFDNNNANRGGAIFFMASQSIFKNCSTIMFKNNTASQDGGAIYIAEQSHFTFMEGANVAFHNNRASDFGGAIYGVMDNSKITFGNSSDTPFLQNSAGTTGDSVYMNLPRQCNSTCLTESVLGITMKDLQSFLITSPNKIQLYNAKVQCINFVTDIECDLYFIQNIMLGQKIVLDACMYDYYGHPVDVALFLISGTSNQGYRLDSNNTLITCNNTLELISIYGNRSTKFNYSINISLYDDRKSESKEVLTKLMIELSPCHAGFSYNINSQKCECYNASGDIVFCSGSSSTIKRGYWFGNVTGKPTVTFCPINYCNFTCCETSNGYYHLSPVRDNQCRSHRSGTACGSCTDGYTLSYDSTECVSVESCTAGQTVLVVLLTVIYWIVMVTLVFAMMYYKVGIGYLYSTTYYYSIVDILLSRNIYASRGLYLTVNIMSSFSKIIPQFLGELCLSSGLSGIDQQFIHYAHPLAVILILIIISLLARRSQRVSVFISRGIIHVICLLLLLSYTSIVSTSLLLMRSLTFHGIHKVYTYLSPDMQYFHDRHLAYGIVALLFIIFLVIGPPLLLTLEPFLNHKFNFIKIKPLLDQFQGCYKDKYRCFAGYYMICRLVIITIVISNSSNDFVANYLLIITCGIIALLHLLIKPYNSGILNKLDGIILHLVIFITALSLFDDFDSPLVITFSFVLVFLPLLMIIGIAIFLHKDDFWKSFRVKSKSHNKNELLMADYHLIISDDMRENATICDM